MSTGETVPAVPEPAAPPAAVPGQETGLAEGVTPGLAPAPPAPIPARHEELRRTIQAATRRSIWITGLVVSPLVAAFFYVMVRLHGAGMAFWGLKGIGAVAAGLGVRLSALGARKKVRQLPDAEAYSALMALAAESDETTSRVASHLMKGIHPEGTEVVPAGAAEGKGNEVASVEPPLPRGTR